MLRPRIIAPSIEMVSARTPTLPPATHTNSYALGGRDVLLVEPATPFEDERLAWLAWARGLIAAGRRPLAVFATHHHPDHVGGASFFAEALGLPLWAHEQTAARIQDPVDRTLVDGEALLLDGPVPQRWQVLHTPGHAAGHLCLFERSLGVAVVGDMVASEGTILISPDEGDMGEYLAQLRRLASLPVRTALPAHGGPIDEPTMLFERYITHRLAREAKVLDAVSAAGAQGATAEALLPTAYADTSAVLFPIALLSLRAHLDKLVRDGAVRADGERFVAEAPQVAS